MDDNLLDSNLDNIKETEQVDLFGEVHREKELSMKDRIGFLPISVWKPDWQKTKELKDLIGDDGEHRELLNKNIVGLPGFNKGASIFNPHLAQMILSAYCPAKANIYDPFGGGGTRGFIASAMGHSYTGVEIRQEEVDAIKRQQEVLKNDFRIICDDSRTYEVDEEEYDFSYTCPPYYDLEKYSTLEGDSSNANTYDEFLEMTKDSFKGVYKALKTGAISVWVVGNFRDKKGYLQHFNGDLARIGKEVGFNLHDELIFWGASGAAHQRVGQFEANRKSVRVHEYILIFKK